jgi:hypothetical protein
MLLYGRQVVLMFCLFFYVWRLFIPGLFSVAMLCLMYGLTKGKFDIPDWVIQRP